MFIDNTKEHIDGQKNRNKSSLGQWAGYWPERPPELG